MGSEATRLQGSLAFPAFQLLERAGPVLAQQARQRPVGQQAAARLTRDAVVRLVRRIRNSLHRRATDRTWLAVSAMNGHAFPEGRHLLREFTSCFLLQPIDPRGENQPGGIEEPRRFLVRQPRASA